MYKELLLWAEMFLYSFVYAPTSIVEDKWKSLINIIYNMKYMISSNIV